MRRKAHKPVVDYILFKLLDKTTYQSMLGQAAPGGSGGGQQDVRYRTGKAAADFFGAGPAWTGRVTAIGSMQTRSMHAEVHPRRNNEWRVMRQHSDRHPAWSNSAGFPVGADPSRLPTVVLWLARANKDRYFAGLLSGDSLTQVPPILAEVVSSLRVRTRTVAGIDLVPKRDSQDGDVVLLDAMDATTPFLATGLVVTSRREHDLLDQEQVSDSVPKAEKTLGRAAKNLSKYRGPITGTKRKLTITQVRVHQRALRKALLSFYEPVCSVCRSGLTSNGYREVEAVHIVDVAIGGTTHVRNGLLMCRTHHWAFDHGLFIIDEKSRVQLVGAKAGLAANFALKSYAGKRLLKAKDRRASPDPDALQVHRARWLH